MEKVYIFDTTLRDGEQSCGVSLSIREKLDIARQLTKLGVDIIEAGFPIASAGDFASVRAIAEEIDVPIIAALARVLPEDIERAAEAIKPAKRKRIHVFLATSKIHREYKLKKPKEEILKMAVEGVRFAKSFTDDVEFSPEDASRTEKSFLYEVLEAAIEAGATTVNIPDTVGYAMPTEFGILIADIKMNVKNIDKAIISVHCHNDMGMAVANSLSAVMNGARQVECTMNGIGERAGNASLDEIVMAIKTRADLFQAYTGINTQHIYKTSKMVAGYTGMVVQQNKAVVGANAFAHSSGIHQDGFLKERTTYEIMKPEDIGLSESKIVLTKLSGRHALKKRLEDLGFSLTDEELSAAFKRFKELADKKKEIFDEDLQALIEDEVYIPQERFKLAYLNVVCGTGTIPTAIVHINDEERVVQGTSGGNGPIDAIYLAIDKAIGISSKLKDYSVSALTGEKEAMGEVTVRIECEGKEAIGRGISTDITEASAKAYLSALNKAVQKQK
ncbi:MAG: 2-isopropylmalate synthase [bacterium]